MTGDPHRVRVTDVHLGEYAVEETGGTVQCTESKLEYVPPDGPAASVPLDRVDRIVADRSEELTGFRRLGLAFAALAVVFTMLSVPFALRGIVSDPVALGSYLSAGLSWYGAVAYYRRELPPLSALEIHADGQRLVFLAEEGRLDDVAETLAELAACDGGATGERGRRVLGATGTLV